MVETLKRLFCLDHLQTNFSVQKQFIDLVGSQKLNMDSRLNSFDFEATFPDLISRMLILQKFLNKDVRSFKFLMKVAEFQLQRVKLLHRQLNRQRPELTTTLLRHHRDLLQSFKRSFENLEKCEKTVDRLLRLIRSRKSEPVHVVEFERVLVRSLDFGCLFASKVFEVNDTIKAFYQVSGMKKAIFSNLFQMDFVKGSKFLLTQRDLFEKPALVFNQESRQLDRVYSHLRRLRLPRFEDIPHFVGSVQQALSDLKKIPVSPDLPFLGLLHRQPPCPFVASLSHLICYFRQSQARISRLSSFAQDISLYQDDPVFNLAPFAKVDSREHEQEFFIFRKFPLLPLDGHDKAPSPRALPFPEYRRTLEDIFCFLREFHYLFESPAFAGLAKEIGHLLKICDGDMSHFLLIGQLLARSKVAVHPTLRLFKSKFVQARERVFRFMRTSIKYSFEKDLLYKPNNVLHFALHWNQMFHPASLSEDRDESPLMDLFKINELNHKSSFLPLNLLRNNRSLLFLSEFEDRQKYLRLLNQKMVLMTTINSQLIVIGIKLQFILQKILRQGNIREDVEHLQSQFTKNGEIFDLDPSQRNEPIQLEHPGVLPPNKNGSGTPCSECECPLQSDSEQGRQRQCEMIRLKLARRYKPDINKLKKEKTPKGRSANPKPGKSPRRPRAR